MSVVRDRVYNHSVPFKIGPGVETVWVCHCGRCRCHAVRVPRGMRLTCRTCDEQLIVEACGGHVILRTTVRGHAQLGERHYLCADCVTAETSAQADGCGT